MISESPTREKARWSGARDRNGVKVYEGDILRSCVSYLIVRRTDGHYYADDISTCFRGLRYSPRYFDLLRVVGNIHTDPQLLAKLNRIYGPQRHNGPAGS